MPAYLIGDTQVLDEEIYDEYQRRAIRSIKSGKARALAATEQVIGLEGDWCPRRLILIEYPDLSTLRSWYYSDEYQELKELRLRGARSDIRLVGGVEALSSFDRQGNEGYVLADVGEASGEEIETYRSRVPASVERFGGRFIVRGGESERVEGNREPQRTVVIEFPSLEVARTWYDSDEYSELAALRQRNSSGSLFAVNGL
jgi:uncharacterized protein (DUF1330 family)